ncbi:MAG: hypothetical protein LBE06_08185 [Azoarcus sp.]|nr:hypothetical protein [Azoarcus sp.]
MFFDDYGSLSDEAVSPAEQMPARYLDFLDASLKACALPAGKDTPDPDTSENKWLERFFAFRPEYSTDDYDTHFNRADAMALAGPSVKDGVTRYWRRDGKTRIRFAFLRAWDLRSWARRRGIAHMH